MTTLTCQIKLWCWISQQRMELIAMRPDQALERQVVDRQRGETTLLLVAQGRRVAADNERVNHPGYPPNAGQVRPNSGFGKAAMRGAPRNARL